MNDVAQPGGPDEIVRVDATTGVATRLHVFSSGLNFLESLAYDARQNVLWSTNSDVLTRINLQSFNATAIGKLPFGDVDGLAVQPLTGALFGVTYSGNDLIRIDKSSASATLVNGHVEEGSRLEDLAFDSSGWLYILTSNALVRVDPANGNRISKVGLSGATSLESLIWDAPHGTFLSAADRGNFKDLVAINRSTGQVSFLSALHSGFKDIEALAFVPDVPIVPVEMQALDARRNASGAWLAWEARLAGAPFLVQRARRMEGPWQDVARVTEPLSGRDGHWRFEWADVDAAGPELGRVDLVYRVGAADELGRWSWLSFELAAPPLPRRALLRPNSPNPFNPSTAFEVQLPVTSRIDLVLSDVRGRLVRHLQTGPLGPGTHAVTWDGRDDSGRPLPSGVYAWAISAGGSVLRGQAVLVK